MTNYWVRIQRRRIARRRFLQAAALSAASAAAAWSAACGGGDDEPGPAGTPAAVESPSAAATATPKIGGRYQDYVYVDFDGFDPHRSIASSLSYFPRVYNNLLSQSTTNPDFMYMDLAESYEHPDDQTYVFKIREGVRIAPNTLGVPERAMDGEDVRASLDRLRESSTFTGGFVKDSLESYEPTDEGTFVMKAAQPYAWFLNVISDRMHIAPRELFENDVPLITQGVGGGPLKLTSSVEGQGAVLDRNPNYYRSPKPYIDGIDVKVIPDRATQRTAFLSKQLHTYQAENVREANELTGDGSFYIVRDPEFTYISLALNVEREPLNDPRVRRAISRAINRQQFIDILRMGEAKPDGIVHWPTGPYALPEEELSTKYQPYDPEEARELLAAAGHPDGITIKMVYPTVETLQQHLPILLEQFAAVGITVEQEPVDLGAYLDRIRPRDYETFFTVNQIYETPERPLNYHRSIGPAGDGAYTIGLNDPEVDAAIEKAHRTTDPKELIKAVHDAQALIYSKDPAWINLYSGYTYKLYWTFVKNVPEGMGRTGLFLFPDMWLDL